MPSTYHLLCLWTVTPAFLYHIRRVHCCVAVEAPFGMTFNKKVEAFHLPLTSAASGGPHIHSPLAFLPSWPKILLKRESASIHRLVSKTLAAVKDMSQVVKKPVLHQMCRKCHRLLFLQKTSSFSFTKYSYHWRANPFFFPEGCFCTTCSIEMNSMRAFEHQPTFVGWF